MICPHCDGQRGELIVSPTGWEPDFFDACDECEGTGEVPECFCNGYQHAHRASCEFASPISWQEYGSWMAP